MKKSLYLSTAAVIILILASACIFSASQKTTKYTLAAPYTLNLSKENGDVYYIKGQDSGGGSNIAYYNLDKLDKFIENSSNNEKGKIRVIKYEKNDDEYSLEWMYDIEYDGRGYKLNIYDNDSIVNNKYNAIFTKFYDILKKTSDKSYKFYSNTDDRLDLL